MKIFVVLCGLLSINVLSVSADYSLEITSDSPIATGTFVTFNVTLLENGKLAPNKPYQFSYEFSGRTYANTTNSPSIQFIIPADNLEHGRYSVEFIAEEYFIFVYFEKARSTAHFDVTNRFTGNMELTQGVNKTVRDNGYVSSESETLHNIIIDEKDKKLYDQAAYIRVFWFVNCLYMGVTDTLNFTLWYKDENAKFNIEALLELSYTPLPDPTTTTQAPTTTSTTTESTTTTTTSTTTTTTTTTTQPTTTTTSTTPSTTTSSSTTTTTKKPSRRRRDSPIVEWNVEHLIETGSIRPENIANEKMLEAWSTTSTSMPMEERIHMLENGDDMVPYFGVCTNNTRVFSDPKKIYGYYQRTVIVENPVQNVTVSNNVWLKHSDMCDIKLKYRGTSPFKYCMKVVATNNVSVTTSQDVKCSASEWKETVDLEITYSHFFPKHSNSYIVEFVIKNEVSEVTMPIGVQFYEAQSHSQLSVIIVPVIFSLVAVVFIVFGVAYYVQNRNQFLVETADFNFGDTQSVDSLEYKSFLQRLLDSVSDVFIKHDYLNNEEPDSPALHGDSNIRYGNMN